MKSVCLTEINEYLIDTKKTSLFLSIHQQTNETRAGRDDIGMPEFISEMSKYDTNKAIHVSIYTIRVLCVRA